MPIKAKDTAVGMRAELANVVVGTVLDGLTAAGTNQATALTLTLDDNHVFTTVGSGTGCIFLPTYAPGDVVRIANFGANALNVYPPSGGTINTGATNAPISIPAGWNGNFTARTVATTWIALTGANGTVVGGTVTSVAMTGDGTVYNAAVPGSPITTSGTLAPTLHTQSAHTVLAGPTSGSAVAPTFRALIASDIPLTPKWYGGVAGVMTASQLLFDIIMTGTETFAINFPGNLGGCTVAPTGSVTFAIKKNGSSVGTMNIAGSATTATWTLASPLTFASGDHFQFYAPSSIDATLSGPSYTFVQS